MYPWAVGRPSCGIFRVPSYPRSAFFAFVRLKAAALDAALAPVIAAESALRAAQAVERERRKDLGRTLRKTAALLRAHFMDEKKVDAFFPSVAEAKVPEDDEGAAV